MIEKEIAASRSKTALYLAGSLVLVATSLLLLQHPDQGAWKLQLGMVFFGLCAATSGWLLVRPQRLLLDDEGFMVCGGFVRSPKKIPWSDIEVFFVFRLPRGGKAIGFNYKPGAWQSSMMVGANRLFGADGALPKGWRQSPESIVDELNAHRVRVSGDRHGRGPAAVEPPPGNSATPRAPSIQARGAHAKAMLPSERVSGMKVLVCSFDPKFGLVVEADADAYGAFCPATTRATFASAAEFLNALADGFDVVHLFGEVGGDQRIAGLGYTGAKLIEECASASVKLLWVASDNDPQIYIDGFTAQGRGMNLIMTLARRGPIFSDFLRKLLSGMHAGDALPQAYVRLSPQGAPPRLDVPATIFKVGDADWPVPRSR